MIYKTVLNITITDGFDSFGNSYNNYIILQILSLLFNIDLEVKKKAF